LKSLRRTSAERWFRKMAKLPSLYDLVIVPDSKTPEPWRDDSPELRAFVEAVSKIRLRIGERTTSFLEEMIWAKAQKVHVLERRYRMQFFWWACSEMTNIRAQNRIIDPWIGRLVGSLKREADRCRDAIQTLSKLPATVPSVAVAESTRDCITAWRGALEAQKEKLRFWSKDLSDHAWEHLERNLGEAFQINDGPELKPNQIHDFISAALAILNTKNSPNSAAIKKTLQRKGRSTGTK
jgi:hypothetical protein